MTLVIDEVDASKGQVHALIIGVGRYPHMQAPQAAAFGLDANLTSPPISAAAFARFVADEFSCPQTPVGSIDLYLSGADTFSSDKTGPKAGIADASTEVVLQAVLDWKERVATQPGNVALFYFCGHGVEKVRQLGLLLSDFGAKPNPMESALNLTNTQAALGALATPKLQCFFVDACRQPSLEALRREGNVGRDPLGWETDLRAAQDSSIFYATLPVDPAYGLANEVAPFTKASLRALRGLGARKRGVNDWVVTTNRLQIGIGAAMRWAQHHENAPPQDPASGGWHSNLPLHQVADPGEIPVSIDVLPHDAIQDAEVLEGNQRKWRWNNQVPWRLQMPVGAFVGQAKFGDPHWVLEPQDVRPLPPEEDLLWEAKWREG